MTEHRSQTFQGKQSNRVVKYVLDAVPNYGVLNAPNYDLGNERFTQVTAEVVANSHRVEEEVETSIYFALYGLAETPNVVLKRLRTEKNYIQGSARALWKAFREEHELVDRYFGRRFVPYTEFITLNTDTEEQYFMVQERIEGHSLSRDIPTLGRYRPFRDVSQQMQGEVAAFITCYEDMQDREHAVIEDQIMVDFIGKGIKISDTNNLQTPAKLLTRGKSFFDAVGIDNQSVQTTQDVVAVMQQTIKPFVDFDQQTYRDICSDLSMSSIKRARAESYISATYGQRAVSSFQELAKMVRYFPPEGNHNVFIDSLMVQFGITEADLAQVG